MKDHLAELERRAIALRSSEQPREAAAIFERILEERPDWEHGYGSFNLAGCYEDLGELEKARISYEKAVELNPYDALPLGGYASFLYLHGDASKAFDIHLRLLSMEVRENAVQGAAQTIIAVKALGRRLGLSDEAVETRIADICDGKSI